MADDGRWPAPAKLNWFLHLAGKRADGYHELRTLFQFVDWCDRLAVRPAARLTLRCRGPVAVPGTDNLVLGAAELLQRHTGCRAGAAIELDKRLPVGAGLGGGSSDAATALHALNELWDPGLDTEALAALGLKLGADVPVFIRGHAALAEGVGDVLTPVAPECPWYVILCPGTAVSTAAVFGHSALTQNGKNEKISGFPLALGRNDCEAAVRALAPEVGRAMDWLSASGNAHLTGTGSAVFAAFDSRAEARAVADRVPAPWKARVARGVNVSPLMPRLR